MEQQILVELFSVSIEAFAAILGIIGAILLFIIHARRDRVGNVEGQLISSFRHIKQIIGQISLIIPKEWEMDNFEEWLLAISTNELDSRLLEIIECYYEHHDDEVITDHGKSTFYHEYRLYWPRILDLHQEYIQLKNQFMGPPKNILTLLIIMMIPILYSLMSLLFLTYDIYEFMVNGYFAFFVDVLCILVFIFYSYIFYRDM